MTKEILLIVDDEVDMLEGIKRLLGYELPEIKVEICPEARKAVELARMLEPDVVLLDIRMPGLDGITLLGELQKLDPQITCIMMTAHGTIELAVKAMKTGAYDFITKPFNKETLIRVLTKGLERNRLIRENRFLRSKVVEADFHGMIGKCTPMQQLFDRIKAIARSDYSVLIRGESGTGKELTARAIHEESNRNRRKLVIVNCPATPEHLLESELFGYRRGAFTSADRDQKGLFEEADGGTIFLDEIGDIPVSIQTKLLRTLQDGEIKPLGSVKPIKVDARIIAATNQNLEQKIQDRTFREDLFYRLNVVSLKTPNLKEAMTDIPLLAKHFAKIASNELEIPHRRFSSEALKFLTTLNWPGNVRQLQNFIRRIVMFSVEPLITDHHLKTFLEDSIEPAILETNDGTPEKNNPDKEVEPYKDAKERVINKFTSAYIETLLEKTGGNVSKSAELSGLGRPSLQKIMRRLDIKADRYR